jgi:hypothetical protein
MNSLHTSSDVVLKLLTAYYNIFVDNFDSVKYTTAVFSNLHNSYLIKLSEL